MFVAQTSHTHTYAHRAFNWGHFLPSFLPVLRAELTQAHTHIHTAPAHMVGKRSSASERHVHLPI